MRINTEVVYLVMTIICAYSGYVIFNSIYGAILLGVIIIALYVLTRMGLGSQE